MRQIAATPSGPTSFSTKGMRPLAKMQLTSPGIRAPSAPLVHEGGGDLHGPGESIAHRRLAVDRLLAPLHALSGSRALDGHRVADVREAIGHGLVVTEQAAEVDVGLHLHAQTLDGNVEERGVGGDPRG